MEWTDEGIVLGIKRHGEANAIVELMTREHGRHLGLVRGGAGSRMRPVLQPGNSLRAVWRARLDEHLGTFAVEGLQLRAGSFLTFSHAVYAVTHLGAMTRLLPERDPHENVFHCLQAILDHVDDAVLTAALVVRFEIALLTELGFGLDLERCAATGSSADLVYVSPKSGRAVSASAGEEWSDKLLRLPAFLRAEADTRPALRELGEGFALSEYFLARNVLEPRGLTMPEARHNFISAIARAIPNAA
jgi:DNA repair protein RecO (recombination protein O)